MPFFSWRPAFAAYVSKVVVLDNLATHRNVEATRRSAGITSLPPDMSRVNVETLKNTIQNRKINSLGVVPERRPSGRDGRKAAVAAGSSNVRCGTGGVGRSPKRLGGFNKMLAETGFGPDQWACMGGC